MAEKHHWKSIGVFTTWNSGEYQVFKCTHCNKCKREELEYV